VGGASYTAGAVSTQSVTFNDNTVLPGEVAQASTGGSGGSAHVNGPDGEAGAAGGIGKAQSPNIHGDAITTLPTEVPASPAVPQIDDTQNRRPEFRWNASVTADSYELWVNVAGVRAAIHESSLSAVSFTPTTDLSSGRIVYWVRARNAAGWGNWSAPVTFQIAPQTSQLTVVESVSSTGTSRPTIKWNADSRAIGYDVWMTHLTTGNVIYHQKNLSTTAFTPTTNLASGQYRVWARAVTSGGRGRWSSPVNFRIGNGVIPGRAVVTNSSSSAVPRPEFSWQAVEGATHYELWVTDTNTGTRVIHHRDLTSTNFTPNFNLSDSTLRVWVRAGNAAGMGRWSAPHTLVMNLAARPGAVPDVSTQLSGGGVSITWDAATNADSYDVSVRNVDTGNTIFQGAAVSGTTLTLANTLAAGSYTVSVRARNGIFEGPWNTNNRFSIAATPSAVTFGSIPLKGSTTQNATITWNAVPAALAYDYRLTRIKPTSNPAVLEGRVNNQSFASVSFLNHQDYSGTYSVEVRAITSTSVGPWSNGPNFYYIGKFTTAQRDLWVLGVNTDARVS